MNPIEKIPEDGGDAERLRFCEVLSITTDSGSVKGVRRLKAGECWLPGVTLVGEAPNPGGAAGGFPPCEVLLLTVRVVQWNK